MLPLLRAMMLALPVTLSGCGIGSASTSTDSNATCPPIWYHPVLSVSPLDVRVGDEVRILVSLPAANECGGYTTHRVEVFLNGQLLQAQDLTSKTRQDVAFSWTVTAGKFGVAERGESDVFAKAVAYTSSGVQQAHAVTGRAAAQDPYTSRIHVQAPSSTD